MFCAVNFIRTIMQKTLIVPTSSIASSLIKPDASGTWYAPIERISGRMWLRRLFDIVFMCLCYFDR